LNEEVNDYNLVNTSTHRALKVETIILNVLLSNVSIFISE